MSRWSRLPVVVALSALALLGCSREPIKINVPIASQTTQAASKAIPPPATPGRVTNSKDVLLASGGTQRRYRTHYPIVSGTGPRPLIVALHKGASSPQGMEYSIGLDSVADRLSLYVVYPEALGGYWNNGRSKSVKRSGGLNDVQFIVDVVKNAKKKLPIDSKRIFITGEGDGGIMALQTVAATRGIFQGVAVVSGQLRAGQPLPKAPMPALFIHGTADPVFPWQGIATVKDGGPLISVDATVKAYLALNGMGSAKPTVTAMPDRDAQDATTVTRSVWGPSAKGFTVTLYTVTGGGNPWPGGNVVTRNQSAKGRTSRDLDTANVVGHFAIEGGRAKTAKTAAPSSTPAATTPTS